MRIRSILLSAAFVLLAATPALAQKKFENDGNHTFFRFKASTTLFDVEGWFDKYNLDIKGDPADPKDASIKIELDTASINTRNKTRDKHLQSPDFFDAKKNKKITFTSSKVTKDGEKYVVTGTLDMHGVKKEISIPFSHTRAKNGAGYEEDVFKGSLTINRKDYGIGVESVAAKLSLADEVELRILIAGFVAK